LSIDFGRTAETYARWRAAIPDVLFDRLPPLGRRVLDIGSGTGTAARALARRGYDVVALDPSAAMLRQAPDLRRVRARAEALPLRRFDAAMADQCWIWLDGPRVAAELRRLLPKGGMLVVGHFDFMPLPGNVVEATEALIKAHNPAAKTGLDYDPHRNAGEHLPRAGFSIVDSFIVEISVPYTHEAWRGRFRANAYVGASLGPDAAARFDADLAALLRSHAEPLATPHRVCAMIARRD
jgi:SAM-dependent methyltransferase